MKVGSRMQVSEAGEQCCHSHMETLQDSAQPQLIEQLTRGTGEILLCLRQKVEKKPFKI